MRMEGLMVLGAYALYAWLSVWIVKKAAREARARGISGWKWGVPAALVMYHLLLWDWVPTVIAHRYYCQKDAGFVVHKTLDQWKQENPGVAETLSSTPAARAWGSVYPINQRFALNSTSTPVFLSVSRNPEQIIDTKTNDVMWETIDYSSGARVWGPSLNDYRTMFFRREHCVPPVEGGSEFYKRMDSVATLGLHKEESQHE
jgi:hypothetical protein